MNKFDYLPKANHSQWGQLRAVLQLANARSTHYYVFHENLNRHDLPQPMDEYYLLKRIIKFNTAKKLNRLTITCVRVS